VAVVSQLSDHLTLPGNVPLGFDDVPSSLLQMFDTVARSMCCVRATCDCVQPFRRVGMSLAAPGTEAAARQRRLMGALESKPAAGIALSPGSSFAYHRQLPTGVGS
jgi:hypothetical protein